MLNRYEINCYAQCPDDYRCGHVVARRRFKTHESAKRAAQAYSDKYPLTSTNGQRDRGSNSWRTVTIYDLKRVAVIQHAPGRVVGHAEPPEHYVLSVGELGYW